jgi:site-specific DNA recombinase
MVTAGCYARKSTDEGDKAADAKSVMRQIERARAFATARGWRFDDGLVFSDDGISGGEFRNRPGLNRLLETLKATPHTLNALVVSEQSRLGRDTIRTLALLQTLNDAGTQVWSYLEDKELSLADEMAEVEQFMRSWAGASERRKASQRVRDKMRQLAEQGKSTGGRLFGYTTQGGQRTVDPSEASIVRRIFKRRAQGAGYFQIARELERDGIPSPRGSTLWSNTQVGAIVTNPTYAGTVVWGRTRQTNRRGTPVTEPSPEPPVRREAPGLRVIADQLWREVQAVNKAATEATWRSPDGRGKSRPTESKHLLTPFLACGVCGGSMHVRYSKKRREYLFCTNRHLLGKTKCSNARRLPVPLAEKAIMQAFEEALVGTIVMTKLEEVLEAHRAAQADPAPLRAEAQQLRTQIARLVASLARGEIQEVHDAIAERKTRLAQVEDELAATAAVQGVDVEQFREGIEEVAADWRVHLRSNKAAAQRVIRKILPEKLRVTPRPSPGVEWEFEGLTDYRKVLEEVGYQAVTAAVLQGLKLSRTPCPSPCSARPSARGTPRSRRTPPR